MTKNNINLKEKFEEIKLLNKEYETYYTRYNER